MAEVVAQLRVVRFPGQVDGGEIGANQQREHAGRDRERIVPAVRIAGRQRAEAHPEQDRRQRARRAEHVAPGVARHVAAGGVGAEDVGGAAQHDPDQHQMERPEQRDARLRVGGGEAREQQHDEEDQPDVVGFPHRPYRLGQCVAMGGAPLAARHQIPDAGAEVRTREHGIARPERRT